MRRELVVPIQDTFMALSAVYGRAVAKVHCGHTTVPLITVIQQRFDANQ
jgi:hypothetical protein